MKIQIETYVEELGIINGYIQELGEQNNSSMIKIS